MDRKWKNGKTDMKSRKSFSMLRAPCLHVLPQAKEKKSKYPKI